MTQTKTTAKQSRENLDAAYEASFAAVICYLDEIRNRIHDLPAPESDELNWAHLGSMTKVRDDLHDIVQFLGGSEQSKE